MTIDTSKLRISTKSLAGALTFAGAAWQVPAVHDAVLAFVHAHPHWSGLAGFVAGMWTLLHNPQVAELLGVEKSAQ